MEPMWTVEVTVATARPPRADDIVWFRIPAADALDAQLFACHWAMQHKAVVMVVNATVLDWPNDG